MSGCTGSALMPGTRPIPCASRARWGSGFTVHFEAPAHSSSPGRLSCPWPTTTLMQRGGRLTRWPAYGSISKLPAMRWPQNGNSACRPRRRSRFRPASARSGSSWPNPKRRSANGSKPNSTCNCGPFGNRLPPRPAPPRLPACRQWHWPSPSPSPSPSTRATRSIDLDEAETRALIDRQLRDAGWEADTKCFATPAAPARKRAATWPLLSGLPPPGLQTMCCSAA